MIAKFGVSATPRARYACCGCRRKSRKSSFRPCTRSRWGPNSIIAGPHIDGAVVLVGIPASFLPVFPESRRPPLLRIRLDFANGRFGIWPGGSKRDDRVAASSLLVMDEKF